MSVLGVSQFLGLPYETARRHTGRLEKMGFCQKVGGKEHLRRKMEEAAAKMASDIRRIR